MWLPRILGNKSARQEFFCRNGEILLRKQISFSEGRSNPIRTFTLKELQQATNNFDPRHRQSFKYHAVDPHSELYWGILDKSKVVIDRRNTRFIGDTEDDLVEATITEIVILSTIHHRNVERLLGCCLETRVPLLVREFVPTRNLERDMTLWVDKGIEAPSWSTRLQIAINVADALNYLHSYTSRPIVHKNVQAAVIILEEGYTAKLAGFRHSVPIPPGETQVKEDRVTGTYGFMDPDYVATGRLTEKFDVHAFGMLLLELMTGEGLTCYVWREGKDTIVLQRRLILDLIGEREDLQEPPQNHVESTIKEDDKREKRLALEEACLTNLVACASSLGDGEGKTEQFRVYAELALKCAQSEVHQRPTMKEVVEELKRIRGMACH